MEGKERKYLRETRKKIDCRGEEIACLKEERRRNNRGEREHMLSISAKREKEQKKRQTDTYKQKD